jgi:hypothetical protein
MVGRASVCYRTLGFHQEPSPVAFLATRCATCHRVTSLFAALTETSQLVKKSATLSPAFATLTHSVARKSFACHSYRKPWGVVFLLAGLPTPSDSELLTTHHSSLTTHHSSFTSHYPLRFDILLRPFAFFCTFLPSARSHPLSFQQNTHSLRKTPGGGVSHWSPIVARHFFPRDTEHGSRPPCRLSAVDC